MTIQRTVLYRREALSTFAACVLLAFLLAMGGCADREVADEKDPDAESSVERVRLINLAAEESLIRMANLVEGLSGEAEQIAVLSSHLTSAAAAIRNEDEEELKISMQAVEESLAGLGLGRGDLLREGINPPGNLVQLDAISLQQPLPGFAQADGQLVVGNILWAILCLSGYIECLTHESVSACNEMLGLCLGVCAAGVGGVDGGGVTLADCTSSCEQVKQDVSSPLVTVDPASTCPNPPLLSAITAALIADVTDRLTYDWKDDPANTCGADCFCEGQGDGTLTTVRRRYQASTTINGCTLTGSVSVLIEKRRRTGECFPN